jgi:splicing factor 3A subunit 1
MTEFDKRFLFSKVLIPPKDLLPKLRKQVENPKTILDEVKYRVEWAKHQERERQKEEEAKEKERVAYAQVDWHDFVVVETVDFQPNEMGALPPPTTPQEVGARIIAQERMEHDDVEMDVDSDEDRGRAKDNTQVQDMEESGSDDEDEPVLREQRFPPSGKDLPNTAPPLPPPPRDSQPPPPLPPMPDQVMIREYDPKSKRSFILYASYFTFLFPGKSFASKVGADNTVVSPFTGEKIPADKIQEHIRICK